MKNQPVDVISVSKCTYNNKVIINNHAHNFFHILFVIKGNCDIKIKDTLYFTNGNEIYFCPPNILHQLTFNSKEDVDTIEVKFFVHDEYLLERLKCLAHKLDISDNTLSIKMENLLLEGIYKKDYYKQIINISFARILWEIVRQNLEVNIDNTMFLQNEDRSLKSNTELQKIIEYIEINYNKDIKLYHLSNVIMKSVSHLSKQFKEIYRISPMQYINNYRIQKAKELMINTNLNITEISRTVGFQTVHYFSRYFKDKEKITPLQFKSKIKQNVLITLEKSD